MADQFFNESIYNDEARQFAAQVHSDHMQYLPGMEALDGAMLAEVLHIRSEYDANAYGAADVRRALQQHRRGIAGFAALLSPAALAFLEEIAAAAQRERRRYFGTNATIFTPLYISNYCENYCVYCGFNCHNRSKRSKLDAGQMRAEMAAIAATGMRKVLLLTGESRKMSPVEYIGAACKMAGEYFKVVGVEIYPLNSDEYNYLYHCGASYVTVFQETYNEQKYAQLHLAGHKRVFPYRFYAQERALRGGMRGVGFATLLGLDDFRRDALATGVHAWLVQRRYPWAEISFSCPRLRPIINNEQIKPTGVQERELLQIVCAYRLFMPYASITVSTRECARVRDNLMQIAATEISAGVSTGIGSHSGGQQQGDSQFAIDDGRSLAEVCAALRQNGLQPVLADYVNVL